MSNSRLVSKVIWGMLLVAAWLIYRPGLDGAFLFDDWKNLEAISRFGDIHDFPGLLTYLLSGFSSATGRPVAMASFLLDSQTWPADPLLFKRTNVVLHLVNATLLWEVSFRLLRAAGWRPDRARSVALIGAGIWLLHPLWVSTTLYVVQRMTMLATTFVLAGILCYVHGRQALAEERRRVGLAWLWLGVGGALVLGGLSKENALLLALFIFWLDQTLLRSLPSPAGIGYRVWRAMVVWLPALLVVGVLVSYLPDLFTGVGGRPQFTLAQRLWTEGRVLWDYLLELWLPRPYTAGLFMGDAVQPSSGFLRPFTGGLGVAALLGLAWLAWRWRASRPLIAWSLGFFLLGHLLESSWIPLELAFEHRNYLPAVFLFFPVADWLGGPPASGGRYKWVAAILVILAVETLLRAGLWGRPFLQAQSWAQQAPQSARAQTLLAQRWLETGNVEAARRLSKKAVEIKPRDIGAWVNLFLLECEAGSLEPAVWKRMRAMVLHPPDFGTVTRYQLEQALERAVSGGCSSLSSSVVEGWLKSALAGASNPAWRQILQTRLAEVALRGKNYEQALRHYREAVRLHPTEETVLTLSARLATAGALRQALDLLEWFPKALPPAWWPLSELRRKWLRHIGYYQHEYRHLRHAILEDLQKGNGGGDE